MITLKDIRDDERIKNYLEMADANLAALGYTEHGKRHARLTAGISAHILQELGYSERKQELGAIAGYLHDIGNVVNRAHHDACSALFSEQILFSRGMDPGEIALIIGAVGNHDEAEGYPVSPIAAALIIADKSDVHRSRVREKDRALFDIHDRVNYAAEASHVYVEAGAKRISLQIKIDVGMVSVMDYFEIFLDRMNMCRRAAKALSCDFSLYINKNRLL